jgi:hypothetical protein
MTQELIKAHFDLSIEASILMNNLDDAQKIMGDEFFGTLLYKLTSSRLKEVHKQIESLSRTMTISMN